MDRRIETRQLVAIVAMFLIVQFGGLLIASLYFSTTPIVTSTTNVQTTTIQVLEYVLYIIAVAIILLLVIRFYKGNLGFSVMEAVFVILPSFIVFTLIFAYLAPPTITNPLDIYVPALAIPIALFLVKMRYPVFRNTITIIASIGVGLALGTYFSFYFVLLFTGLIAVYDYISVFITKHMITMAQAMSQRNMAFLVGTSDFEAVPRNQLSKKELRDYTTMLKKSQASKNPIANKIMKSGKLPFVSQIQLGAGDLAFPLILSLSTFSMFLSYSVCMVVIIASAIGLLFTMYLLKRYQRALPAIPPMFSFIYMIMGAYLWASGMLSIRFSSVIFVIGAIMFFGMLYKLRKSE